MMRYWTNIKNLSNLDIVPVDGRRREDIPWSYECEDIFTMDTENTSGWLKDGHVIRYHRGESDSYWNDLRPLCIPYIWMVGINDDIYYGRTPEEFHDFCEMIPRDIHVVIFIHNLAYDYAAMLKNAFPEFKVFARAAHKCIYVVPLDMPNIEFRCSYFLTRLSLASWGKKVGIKKRYGDLDYEVIRTPKTELTETELGYCEFDLRIMIAGLKKYRDKYDTIHNIPLTQTGEPRRESKKRMAPKVEVDWYDSDSETYKTKIKRDNSYKNIAVSMLPQDCSDYRAKKKVQAGGYTHGNITKVDRKISRSLEAALNKSHKNFDAVGMHYDVCSLYPYIMSCFKFPMNYFERVNPNKFDPNSFEDTAWMIHLRMDNLKAERYNHFISAHKCVESIHETKPSGRKVSRHVVHYENATIDNGRIVSADYCEIWCTEQDYMTFKEAYSFDETILECYKSKKQYLPKPYVEYVFELYGNKTKLKGVKGMEDLYNESKQFVNSLSGMMQTDIVMDNVTEDANDHWVVEHMSEQDVDDYLYDLANDNKGRTFLSLDWGIWCTAYGRREIARRMMCLDHPWWSVNAVDRNGNSVEPESRNAFDINGVCYVDTDSIFSDIYYDYSDFDKEARAKLEACCDYYELDRELAYPKDPKGRERQLGEFTEESRWTEFKTLHAKCYCVREIEDGQLHLTVSGVNKEGVYCLNDDIDNFEDGFLFDKDSVYNEDIYDGDELIHKAGDYVLTMKQITYITDQPDVVWNEGQYDEYKSTNRYGVNMRQSGYQLNISPDLLQLLCMDNVTDHLKIVQ